MEFRYLYRGTTQGWPGNQVLADQTITCTTTDPLVAALFGVECRNHGQGVILAARQDVFLDFIGPPNHFQEIENAVNLLITPREFARRSELIREVDDVLKVLAEMGFDRMPVRLRDKWSLRQALIGSYEAGHQLSGDQLQHFIVRILGPKR